ncbi:MAG TPA: hypothetical protein VFB81_07635 [Myxococcales bacterium]|nr:hypothetical protein [Myxococcales bacterium]
MAARSRTVFVDSGPFALELSFWRDPRAALNARFLQHLRAGSRGVTSLYNVLEVAGVASHHSPAERVLRLVRAFQALFGVRVVPPGTGSFLVDAPAVADRIARRMAAADAIVLWFAETCRPAPDAFVTWNAKHFEGRTGLRVLTPQQFLRGQ